MAMGESGIENKPTVTVPGLWLITYHRRSTDLTDLHMYTGNLTAAWREINQLSKAKHRNNLAPYCGIYGWPPFLLYYK